MRQFRLCVNILQVLLCHACWWFHIGSPFCYVFFKLACWVVINGSWTIYSKCLGFQKTCKDLQRRLMGTLCQCQFDMWLQSVLRCMNVHGFLHVHDCGGTYFVIICDPCVFISLWSSYRIKTPQPFLRCGQRSKFISSRHTKFPVSSQCGGPGLPWIWQTILRLSKVAPRIEMLNAKLISLRAALESRTDATVKDPFDTLLTVNDNHL